MNSPQNLEVLNVSHNNISTLPYKTFKHLQRIWKLDVSHNNIAEVKNRIRLQSSGEGEGERARPTTGSK